MAPQPNHPAFQSVNLNLVGRSVGNCIDLVLFEISEPINVLSTQRRAVKLPALGAFNMLSSFKGELKSQGAIEAAQDPNSTVTPEDAERVMMNESKKAGATTLKFDPNATPAEKEAQAASVNLTTLRAQVSR